MTSTAFEKRSITWIPVKSLSVVWANAQRPYDPVWAERIAANFEPDQFDPIVVTLPNGAGIYHIVRGQHRRSAVAIRFGEEEKAPCIVIPVGGPEHAAKLWLASDRNQKAAKLIDSFKVAVTANDQTDVDINNVVISCGYHVGFIGPNSKNAIQAVGALRTVYRRFGAFSLKTAINQISATWGKDPNAVVAPILGGYGAFFGEFPANKVNLHRLIDVIQKRYTPGRLLGAARTKRDATGKQMAASVKAVLIERYNHGLKNNSQKLYPK